LKDKSLAKTDTKKEDPSDLLFSMKITSLLLKTNEFTNNLIHDLFFTLNVWREIGKHSSSSILVLKFLLFFMKI